MDTILRLNALKYVFLGVSGAFVYEILLRNFTLIIILMSKVFLHIKEMKIINILRVSMPKGIPCVFLLQNFNNLAASVLAAAQAFLIEVCCKSRWNLRGRRLLIRNRFHLDNTGFMLELWLAQR